MKFEYHRGGEVMVQSTVLFLLKSLPFYTKGKIYCKLHATPCNSKVSTY